MCPERSLRPGGRAEAGGGFSFFVVALSAHKWTLTPAAKRAERSRSKLRAILLDGLPLPLNALEWGCCPAPF